MMNFGRRSKTQVLSVGVALAVALSITGCQTTGSFNATSDPSELKRTWDAAHVYLPTDGLDIPNALKLTGPGGSSALRLLMKFAKERGDFARIPKGKKYPVVIYMHGCTGITGHNVASGIYLASLLNAAVILPVSFAREYRPRNCNPATKTGGMFRSAIRFRIAEANYAIREARKLDWIDSENVFLMGMSEGGVATAKFTGEPVNARIIEGATCHMGWSDWDGLDAPESEPVLSLLGRNDPWQRSTSGWGMDCGNRMSRSNGSKSIVVREGRYANRHEVLMDPEVQAAVKEFFAAHIRIGDTASPVAALDSEAMTGNPNEKTDDVKAAASETNALVSPAKVGASSIGESATFDVQAQAEQWLDSGVQVVPGQIYKISAWGSWTVNAESCGWSGPDGGSGPCSAPLSAPQAVAASYSALVAKIDDGPAFLVGKGIDFTADRNGTLYFRVNDAPGGFHNNEGTVTVRSTLVSSP